MKRIIMMLGVAALLVAAMAVSAVPAFAVSPAQQQCEAAGGTFSNPPGGETDCTFTSTTTSNPSGNPNAGAEPFTQTTTTTTTQKGQGGGGGEASNPQSTKNTDKGPNTNPGGGTPAGQQ